MERLEGLDEEFQKEETEKGEVQWNFGIFTIQTKNEPDAQ